MAVEPQMQRRWEEQLAGYVTELPGPEPGNSASQVVQFVSKMSPPTILYFGAKLVIDGNLSVGELVAFNMLAGQVSAPVLRLAQIWQDFHQARLSIHRLGDILNAPAEPTYTTPRALPAIRGGIRFDHVTFRYRLDGPQVLHDVTFDVPAGQTVGIVGPPAPARARSRSSSSVSTCRKAGACWSTAWISPWPTRPGCAARSASCCRRTCCSTARSATISRSPIRPCRGARHRGARLAGAHEFILELSHGYDTIVGERGSTLSGGQRQRIAIARALVTDPRILIFDEATSALDYESERIIQENMREIVKGRTVFVIAHRLSTVRAMDRIVTLEGGRVIEDGTHDALIKTGGRYASLHRLQAGIHEVH